MPSLPAIYQSPKALGIQTSAAGKPTHPPADRPPIRSASVAAVSETPTDVTNTSGTDYVNVVDAINMDHLTFEEAIIADSLPTDLTPGDYTIFKEIDDIRSDDVAGVVEDDYVPALPTIPPSLKFNGLRPRGWLQRLNVRLDLRLRSGAQPFHRRSIVALKSRHFSPDCSPHHFVL
ncbi:hypothetical protein PSTG_11752 [Puccinia striiformis f. sp. tritici PST-78]|uniref:Uncharacterized protein n=1 Tax=Puccinia striiformis f. sp. tritici PST-78 TaxID=1165861 RepID=A0A0L0V6D9_9BASI|nr:hypothetical protein PSTG_11752 [Puccinia striiformis f. sp. tritici PST-78]